MSGRPIWLSLFASFVLINGAVSCTRPHSAPELEKAKWVFYSLSFQDSAVNPSYPEGPKVHPLDCYLKVDNVIAKGDTVEYFLSFIYREDSLEYYSMPMGCTGIGFYQAKPAYTICDLEYVGNQHEFFALKEDALVQFMDMTSRELPDWLVGYRESEVEKMIK
jgi:hypothetical protein